MANESLLSTRFRDTVSKHKDVRMKSEGKMGVAYPTGFPNFDFLNGAVIKVNGNGKNYKYFSVGVQDGCFVNMIGRSGCGKTTFAIQMAANIVRPFPLSCIFHDDIEGGVQEPRRYALTGFTDQEMEDKYIYRDSGITAENFYERIKIIHDLKMERYDDYLYDTGLDDSHGDRIVRLMPTVYLLDSIALLMPEKFTDEEELSGSMSATAAAKTNSLSFKRIIPMLKAANIILIAINHITTKIDIGPVKSKGQLGYLKQGEETPGGRTVNYLANLFLRFDDNTKLKEGETFGVSGNMVDITLIKSRSARAGQYCTMVFDQARGFDPELGLFVMLKNAGIITGAGVSYHLQGSDIKFSQKGFKAKLAENEQLQAEFSQACANYLATLPIESDVDREKSFNMTNNILAAVNNFAEA